MTLILLVTNWSRNLFCFRSFFEKIELKDVASTKTRKTTFSSQSDSAVCFLPRSQAPRCVHHTTESSSPVCFLPRSQAPRCAAHRRVKIENFGSLRLFLKGHSGEILLRLITSIIKEKIWRKKFLFAKTKILSPRCDAHCETEPWSTISAKSKQNSRIFQPVYQGPRWVQIVEKTGGRKSRDTLPLSILCHEIFRTSILFGNTYRYSQILFTSVDL